MTVISSMMILNEKLTLYSVIGIILIVTGLFLSNKKH